MMPKNENYHSIFVISLFLCVNLLASSIFFITHFLISDSPNGIHILKNVSRITDPSVFIYALFHLLLFLENQEIFLFKES